MLSRMSLIVIFASFTISACDSEPSKSKIENPLAGQLEALEKAKDVEKQLLDAQKRANEAIKKATK